MDLNPKEPADDQSTSEGDSLSHWEEGQKEVEKILNGLKPKRLAPEERIGQ